MGMPVVHLPGGQLARWYLPGKAKRVTALGPAEWLWFIHHAEYVVTNSFHGTVFSLMYHKPFTVALNGKASDARMKSLLDGSGIEGRLMLDNGSLDCSTVVDWSEVDAHIVRPADFGKEYLDAALT